MMAVNFCASRDTSLMMMMMMMMMSFYRVLPFDVLWLLSLHVEQLTKSQRVRIGNKLGTGDYYSYN
jgi:hypothetical protein